LDRYSQRIRRTWEKPRYQGIWRSGTQELVELLEIHRVRAHTEDSFGYGEIEERKLI